MVLSLRKVNIFTEKVENQDEEEEGGKNERKRNLTTTQ